MKRFFAGLLVGLLLATATPALAGIYGQFQGYDIVKVLVNGQEVQSDVPAVKINNRTMVPLRFVSEALGAKVSWDEATNQAKIEHRVFAPADKAAIQATIHEVAKRYLARYDKIKSNSSPSIKEVDELAQESLQDSGRIISALVSVSLTDSSSQEDWKTEGAHLYLLEQALASEYGFWGTYKTALSTRSFDPPKMQAAPMSYWYAQVKTIIEKNPIN